MGVVSELKTVHTLLEGMVWLHLIATVAFYSYYPQTRDFPVDYVSTPGLQGIPVTQRFKSAEWWILFIYAPLILLPLVWMPFMLLHWRSRWRQIAAVFFFALALAILVTVFFLHISWVARRNDYTDPNNPASSNARCCVPEYYNNVPSCRNYGSATPECNPPYALQDLGTSGDEVYFLCLTCAYGSIYAVMLWCTVRMMRATYAHMNGGSSSGSDDGEKAQGAEPALASINNSSSSANTGGARAFPALRMGAAKRG